MNHMISSFIIHMKYDLLRNYMIALSNTGAAGRGEGNKLAAEDHG